MAAYDPDTREQIIPLKDGRTIFKTHNGFKAFCQDKKGNVYVVSVVKLKGEINWV